MQELFDEFKQSFGKLSYKALFSNTELKQLTAVLQLLKSTTTDEPIEIQLLRPIHTRDSKRYVQKARHPAYHLNTHCQLLNKNWRGVFIPKQLKKFADTQGDDSQTIIDKYRSFFPKFIDEHTDILSATLAANAHFLKKYNLHLPMPDEEKRDNTKATEVKEVIIDYKSEITQCIDDILRIEKSKDAIDKQCWQMRYLSNYDIKRIVSDTKYQAKAMAMSELKQRLYASLVGHMQLVTQFNQDNFDDNLLQKLGFVPCGHCIPVTIDDLI